MILTNRALQIYHQSTESNVDSYYSAINEFAKILRREKIISKDCQLASLSVVIDCIAFECEIDTKGKINNIVILVYKCPINTCLYSMELNYNPNIKSQKSLLWLIGRILAASKHHTCSIEPIHMKYFGTTLSR